MKTRDLHDDHRNIYGRGTMQDFMREVEKREDEVNLLDIKNPPGAQPWIIECVFLDLITLFGSPNFCCSLLADDKLAFNATLSSYNPAFVESDLVHMWKWGLATGPGFYSYPHADGSGLCTWAYLTVGTKLWGYLTLKEPDEELSRPTKRRKSRRSPHEEAHKQTAAAFSQYKTLATYSNEYSQAPSHVPPLATSHNIVLQPGMLLYVAIASHVDLYLTFPNRIQPPGITHHVYTLEDSIMIGGHFTMEDTLHLTEWSRFCVQQTMGVGTNAFHPSAKRIYTRLVFALAFQKRQTSKCRLCKIINARYYLLMRGYQCANVNSSL
jgi:hypothetical protein